MTALGDLGAYGVRLAIIALSLVIILFMLGRPALYPPWTIGLFVLTGGVAGLSLVRLFRD